METKVISPKLLLFKEGKTTLKNIFAYSDSAVKVLMTEVAKDGIEPVGKWNLLIMELLLTLTRNLFYKLAFL